MSFFASQKVSNIFQYLYIVCVTIVFKVHMVVVQNCTNKHCSLAVV